MKIERRAFIGTILGAIGLARFAPSPPKKKVPMVAMVERIDMDGTRHPPEMLTGSGAEPTLGTFKTETTYGTEPDWGELRLKPRPGLPDIKFS